MRRFLVLFVVFVSTASGRLPSPKREDEGRNGEAEFPRDDDRARRRQAAATTKRRRREQGGGIFALRPRRGSGGGTCENPPRCVRGKRGDPSKIGCCRGYGCRKGGACRRVRTYRPGALKRQTQNGLRLSRGLRARILARTGETVALRDGARSAAIFHDQPDGAAVFADDSVDNPGGWIYVSNAEVKYGNGGVGAITFDTNGDAIGYKMLLTGTTSNCGGGRTYWNTWITCEENGDDGQIYEVDPHGRLPPNRTVLGDGGGNFESAAYDNRNPAAPRFFVTNDKESGEIRRFTPDPGPVSAGRYHSILTTPGVMEYLVLYPASGTFRWSTSKSQGQASAKENFRSCEGIGVRGQFLHFVSKKDYNMFILDLDAGTYKQSSTESRDFDGQPDQIVPIVSPGRRNKKQDMWYYTEDGSGLAGIHGRDGFGNILTILNAPAYSDETSGLSLSPDGVRMYFAVQDEGILFEVMRTDGRSFGVVLQS